MVRKRQLLAILFADVQGFTSMVERDEDQAKVIKDKFQRVLETCFKTYHGRIISFKGDGVCCTFQSAVEAVKAAIEVQLQMLQSPKVPLRIGIHQGDVILEGKDIFGDGVNIASRVESFALPNSVLVTEIVYHEIRNHVDIKAVSVGKYEFKNAKEPMEIYAISTPGLTIPLQRRLTGKGRAVSGRKFWYISIAAVLILAGAALSYFNFFKTFIYDKSIAVIPFINVSNNPEEEYLSDGFTEDILTSLANIADFKVTSFASTRQYKGTKKTMRQIGNELKVAYVLEGSVQRSGDTLRITAQLIDVKDDAHVWAKNYDESFSEILTIQGKVSREVATALRTKLSPDESKRIMKHPTQNADAYQLYLKGRYYWNQRTREGIDSSIQFFLAATKLDPDYALAYSGIADAFTVLGDNGYLPVDSVSAKAKFPLDKALMLDSSLAEVRASNAIYLSSIEGNGTAAIRELARIVQFNPNYASAFQWYAIELSAKGQFETAKEMIEKAVVLDPRSQRIYESKALIYLYAREFTKAARVLAEAPEAFSNDSSFLAFRADIFFLNGSKDSARYYAQLCGHEILLAILKKDKAAFKRIMQERIDEPRASAESIATFYSMAGDVDNAFVWLKKAVENKEYGGIKFLAVSPYWDALRSDSRFLLLLQNSGIR